jgi:hypothetical protein
MAPEKTLYKKTAFEQNRINKVHAHLGEMFITLHNIEVSDPVSRQARQDALVIVNRLRRELDTLGLHHR